ncbi:hypothetical protein D9757_011289 [Collybiopsis confluens]|uniref:Uncharacterized protein n=1 Tax=Collybiopsis confluens TaxID=2823264 RepID=A0A8H5LSA0_9AGAR|nr:hypothetical protein D9757_011289 [Collybiopsis confluens]
MDNQDPDAHPAYPFSSIEQALASLPSAIPLLLRHERLDSYCLYPRLTLFERTTVLLSAQNRLLDRVQQPMLPEDTPLSPDPRYFIALLGEPICPLLRLAGWATAKL